MKYNVIPGVAELHVDCRILPGTSEADVRNDILARLGPALAKVCDVELLIFGAPAESPAEGPLYDLLARTLLAPVELPVGIITALIGGPFFLWLLLRNR